MLMLQQQALVNLGFQWKSLSSDETEMRLNLIGESGSDVFDDNSEQLTQNWYIHTAKGGKAKPALYPTPGLTLFEDIGTGPIRGNIDYNGIYFVVSGNTFYEVDAAGNSVSRGTLNTSTGICKLDHNGANNGKQICIVDGTNGYIYNSLYQKFLQNKLHISGTAGAATAGTNLHLVAATFTESMEGCVVYNTTDSTKATITAFVDTANVTVSVAVFAVGETFEVGSDSFPDGATHVEFFDGYFLWNNPDSSGQFYKSVGYDGTDIAALDFATAERSPDELEGILKANRILWLVGKGTAEAWHNSGAADFPFEPIVGGFSEWGTIAKYSLVSTAGLSFWVSKNGDGDGMVAMAQGLQVQIISTPEIAAEIAEISDITDCYAYTYQKYQHTFIVFTFPSGQKTIVFDTTEKKFHTWKSKTLGYHRSTDHTFVYDKHLVGDPSNGRIYYLDWSKYTDNGDIIERRRVSETLHGNGKGINWEALELDIKEGVDLVETGNTNSVDMYSGTSSSLLADIVFDTSTNFTLEGIKTGDIYTDTGTGLTTTITDVFNKIIHVISTAGFTAAPAAYTITRESQGLREAQIHVRWRDDNGAWSNWHSRSMGKLGDRNRKVRWRQLGYTRGSRVYEILVSDPVPAVILDAFARINADEKEFR